MEYITIVSKEAIMSPPEWCFLTILGICIAIMIPGVVISIKHKFATLNPVMLFGAIAIVVELILMFLAVQFCSVSTGSYEYGATINKDIITVTEYENFLKTYNPELRDGVYYWIGEELE